MAEIAPGAPRWAVVLILGVVYFVPSMIAVGREQPNPMPIYVINLLLGWTLAGWGFALAMAVDDHRPAKRGPGV